MGDHAPPGRGLSPEEEAEQAAAEEAGRLLFAQESRFVAGAMEPEQLPPEELPEIAFAGRSNVGKSSLVNALTGRTTLARISHTPGRTRQLNFFDLGGRLMLVDMPGYGYAEAPKGEIKRWTGLVRLYLKGRVKLRRALILIDARHGIKPPDRPLMKMLDEAAVSWQAVLTKADKVKPTELQHVIDKTAMELAKHVAAHPELPVTSAHEGKGIAELRAALAALAEPERRR
jgi:GTP-binding protein